MRIARRQFIAQVISARALLGVLGGPAHAGSKSEAKGLPRCTAAREEPFTFAVVADPHCSEKAKPHIEQYGTGVDKFRACVHAMERLPQRERPDFVLVVGDIHVAAFKQVLKDVAIPVHAIAGNHESSPLLRKELRDMFPQDFKSDDREADYYSFVHKSVRFVGICDAGLGGEHVGQLCSENIMPRGQCEWIERELNQREARKIVFAHIPPDPLGQDRNSYMSRNDSRWFNDVVRRSGPEAMFFGHLHRETEEYLIGGTRCFNVRSCCWNFGNASLGFLLVQVVPDKLVIREIETGLYS